MPSAPTIGEFSSPQLNYDREAQSEALMFEMMTLLSCIQGVSVKHTILSKRPVSEHRSPVMPKENRSHLALA